MILLYISFEGRTITNCCRTKTFSPLRQRLTHSHSTQTGRKSSPFQCCSQLPRLTSHFRPQTTVSLSDSRTQSAPDPERRAIKTGSQHLGQACTRAFLPTPALLVVRTSPSSSFYPGQRCTPRWPRGLPRARPFLIFVPPRRLSPSPAAQTSGNYSRSWVQAGSGRKTAATLRAGGVAEARVSHQGPRAATAVGSRELGIEGRGKPGIDGPYLP